MAGLRLGNPKSRFYPAFAVFTARQLGYYIDKEHTASYG